ncbi:MAG TPA: dethiobiotin synthase [Sulfurospirillum sp. UBA12182]|nr:MAG TPA: dethiobiotin synthase [Sulfurospirillum sp. UBA12182]
MHYSPIFITATNTDVGKTYTSLKLIEELGRRGLKVGVLKPIETGVVDEPLDGAKLLRAAQKTNPALMSFTCKDIVPIQFELPASPFVAKGKENIDIKALHVSFEKIAKISDIVLIEGAGGLMVPVDEELYMYNFIKEFGATALLVTHGNLGCINDTLLNLRLLDSLHVKYEWCVNLKENEEHFKEVTLSFYEKKFGEVLIVQKEMEKIVNKLLV